MNAVKIRTSQNINAFDIKLKSTSPYPNKKSISLNNLPINTKKIKNNAIIMKEEIIHH